MPVNYQETEHYEIQWHDEGSDLSSAVFQQAVETTDTEIYNRELDILQLARDIYASPHLDENGTPNLDVPLESIYKSLRDALFSQVAVFADALAFPVNVSAVASATSGGESSTLTADTYYFAVIALDATRRSAASAEVSATATTGQKITVSWSPVTGATSYIVYRGTESGVYTKKYSVSMTVTVPNAPDVIAQSGGTLTPGTYYYKISGISGAIETPASAEASVVVNSPDNATLVTWNTITGASSYRVYRGTVSGQENVYYTDSNSSFDDTGAAGTSVSPSASVRLTDLGNIWTTDTAPIVSAVGATGGVLKLKTVSSFADSQTAYVVDTYSYLPPIVSSVAASGTGGSLATGSYKYRVTAYGTSRESEASAQFTVAVTSGQTVTTSWLPVNDASQYRIYRENPSGTEYRVVTTAGTLTDGILSYTDNGASTEATASPEITYFRLKTTINGAPDTNAKTITLADTPSTYLYRNSTQVFGLEASDGDVIGLLRILASTTSAPTTGRGIEISYDSASNTGSIYSVDRDANPDTYKALEIRGSTLSLGTTESATSVNIDASGNVDITGGSISAKITALNTPVATLTGPDAATAASGTAIFLKGVFDGDSYPTIVLGNKPSTSKPAVGFGDGDGAIDHYLYRDTVSVLRTSNGITVDGAFTAGSGITVSTGQVLFPDGTNSAPPLAFASDTDTGLYRIGANDLGVTVGGTKQVRITTADFSLHSGLPLQWGSSGTDSADLKLYRDAANVLGQRNGASAQSLRIYNTYTDASNYERAEILWESNTLKIGTGNAGTGVARILALRTGGTSRWTIDTSGHFMAAVDNTYDIGASGATRPRHLYIGGNVIAGGNVGIKSGKIFYNTDVGTSSGLRVDEATTNLVINPSLETTSTGWSAASGGSFSRPSSGGLFGTALAQCVTSGNNYGGIGYGESVENRIAVSASTAYTVSVYLKESSGTGTTPYRINITQYTAADADVGVYPLSSDFTLNTSWQRKTLTFTTSATTAKLRIRLEKSNSADTTTLQADGLQLEQKSYATSYCDGSLGTGYSWSGTTHMSTSSRTAGSLVYDSTITALLDINISNRLTVISGNVGIGTTNLTSINTNPIHHWGLDTDDRVLVVSSPLGSTLNLENTLALDSANVGKRLGAVVFSNTSGQSDAHRQLTGMVSRITAYQTYTYEADLGFFTKDGAVAGERLTIKANGNVGIGSIGPDTKLHVVADVTTHTAMSQFLVSGTNEAKRLRIGYDTTNGLAFIQAEESGVGFKKLILNAEGGNVGIGTTSPDYMLDVHGTADAVANFTTNTNNPYMYLQGNGSVTLKLQTLSTGRGVIGTNSNHRLDFLTNGLERITIDADGDAGIGTTTPGSKVHVSYNDVTTKGVLSKPTAVQPNSISGLQVWLKADALSLNDNDLVATWTDSSGNGNTPTQSSDTYKPVYKTNIINGKPVIRFNGSNQQLWFDWADYEAQNVTANTVFAVAAANEAGEAGNVYTIREGTNGLTRHNVGVSVSGSGVLITGGRRLDTDSLSVASGGSYLADTFVIITGVANYTGGSLDLYQNGALVKSLSVADWNGNSQNTQALVQGSVGSQGDSNYFDGDIAELIVFNRSLSSSEMTNVLAYLQDKYGINVASTTTTSNVIEAQNAASGTLFAVNASGNVGVSAASPTSRLQIGSTSILANAPTTSGAWLGIPAATFTDGSTAASGTASTATFVALGQPTYAAANLSVTATDAATLYVANAPAAGTNVTITNAYALWVDAGNTRLDGTLQVSGNTTLTTGQVLLPDGSSSAPSIAFSGDTNTGMFRASADILAISTGGTERWRVDSSGHLLASTDNSFDIGASGATRPRNLYVAGSATVGSAITISAGQVTATGLTHSPSAGSNGVLVNLGGALTEAGSGAHARLSCVEITAPTINAGSATVTNTATLYISGAPNASGATNYALWVAAGTSRFASDISTSGNLLLAGSSSNITMTAATSKIIPGATSFAIRNNADNANNIAISDAGGLTIRDGLDIESGDIYAPYLTNSPSVGNNGALITLGGTITEAASGTHSRLVGTEITAPTVTAGGASVTNAATLYISGAPSASGATNHALWVAGGLTTLGGNAKVGGSGGTVGFFGTTPVSQPADISDLTTNMSPPTMDYEITDVGTSFNQSLLNENFYELMYQVNALRTVLRNLGLMA